jgi:hypothetical protein
MGPAGDPPGQWSESGQVDQLVSVCLEPDVISGMMTMLYRSLQDQSTHPHCHPISPMMLGANKEAKTHRFFTLQTTENRFQQWVGNGMPWRNKKTSLGPGEPSPHSASLCLLEQKE